METYIIVGVLAGIILLLLLVGAPIKPVRLIGQGVIKLMIGALFLFFLNAFGNYIGIHVPINVVTTAVSGFLGIPGVAALVIIQMYII